MNPKLSAEVVLLDSNGDHLGRYFLVKAQQLADEQNLSLVEIGKQNGLSVCRIMDEGKWKYDQKKKNKQQNKQQHASSLSTKEIKFGMRIGEHDRIVKVNHTKELLTKGYPIRLVVEMNGREKIHSDMAIEQMNAILLELGDLIVPTNAIRRMHNNISIAVQPQKKEKQHAKE